MVSTRQPDEVTTSLADLSNPQRTLWESLREPLAGSADVEESPVELLEHLRVLELDFGGGLPSGNLAGTGVVQLRPRRFR